MPISAPDSIHTLPCIAVRGALAGYQLMPLNLGLFDTIDRAPSDFGSEGWEFESLRGYWTIPSPHRPDPHFRSVYRPLDSVACPVDEVADEGCG
jgi:hypothetical protein